MTLVRVGSVAGLDAAGNYRAVSVYQDSGSFKLCGSSGSCIVNGSIEAVVATAADKYVLTQPAFVPSKRAA
jgi:hypothetical protein